MHLHLLPEHPLDHHGAGWVREARHFLGNLLNPWSAFLCLTLKLENQTHRDIRSTCSQWAVMEGHRRFLSEVAPAESPLEVKSLLGLLPHCVLALGLIFHIVDFQIKVPSYMTTGTLSLFSFLSSKMSFLFLAGVKSTLFCLHGASGMGVRPKGQRTQNTTLWSPSASPGDAGALFHPLAGLRMSQVCQFEH